VGAVQAYVVERGSGSVRSDVCWAKQQVQAEVQLGSPWGFKTVRMAVLVEHEKRGGEYEQSWTLSRSMTYATCRPRIWRNGSTAERISRDFGNYSGATASCWCPCEP
jgi:hypothetical protein